MKKFFYFILAFSFLALSCSEEQSIIENPSVTTYTEDVFISVPGARGTEVLEGTISVTLNNETLDLVGDLVPSKNLLMAANLSIEEFNSMLRDYVHGNDSGARLLAEDDPKISTPPSNHAGCMEWCKQNNPKLDENGNKIKKSGQGKCKSNCWTQ